MASRRLFLALLFSVTCPVAWAQTPAGAEFQVNTYTTNFQLHPAVASDANGNFVVAWDSIGQDGSDFGVFGRRFSASGVPQGGEFQVNTYTTGTQRYPAVALDPNGNFIVVWQSDGQDGSGLGVFGQRFDASGIPQGGEFQVNSYTSSGQSDPAVASDANGNFVVVWKSQYQDGSDYGVFGQRFSASGVPQGGEFQVNAYTTGAQRYPGVGSDANGNFVVVWAGVGSGDSDWGVFGQRFNAAGLPQGGGFLVNTYTTGGQGDAQLASDASGNFVVVWRGGPDQDGSSTGVFGQRFDASGSPQGGEFQVNSYTTFNQNDAKVGSDANGNFIVAWHGYGQDGSALGVFGQRFDASGLPQGSEFQVNSFTTGDQASPAVASDATGNFVVVWSGQGFGDFGIFGQRFGDLIFRDGFQ